MTDKEIQMIADEIGLEQILIDANITTEYLLNILHESGYVDLTLYYDGIYE